MGKSKDIPISKFQVNAIDVLHMIPDETLAKLASDTKVDYCTKVLTGERMFYLLLYAFIKCDRISQRRLEDYFQLKAFKFLFNQTADGKVSHSSISTRLKKIDVSFFKSAYELIYSQLSELYTEEEIADKHIVRIDSSMVSETSNKLIEGMINGTYKGASNARKQLKYTVGFDGFGALLAEILTEQKYASEDLAMPKVLDALISKDKHHQNLYTLDRGFSSLANFKSVTEQKAEFVGRLKLNRRMQNVRILSDEKTDKDLGNLELVEDKIVHFYDTEKKGYDDTEFRVIVAKFKQPHNSSRNGDDAQEREIRFVTNNLILSAKEITLAYKKRWDIEVFFRFLKQELSFSHLLSTNENGLKVVLYMTLITAMLVMIYKKRNGIGYSRAKWCFALDMEDWINMYTVYITGGDLSLHDTRGLVRTRIP